MLNIPCPYCGDRDEQEFICNGEEITRPKDPSQIDDKEWANYLFLRENNRGALTELWYHFAGCRKWFRTIRDTVTYKIISSTKLGKDEN